MDVGMILTQIIGIIPKLLVNTTPPRVDYESLIPLIPGNAKAPVSHAAVVAEREAPATIRESTITIPASTRLQPAPKEGVATSCMACSRSHLSTVSGSLNEAMRFAREGGVSDPEVQRRILLAEDEINIMERIDLNPEAIARSPAADQVLARQYLPRIRTLRQELGQIDSVQSLEDIAAKASILSQEFRLRKAELGGVNLKPVFELADQVRAGKISIEEAKERIKKYLPEE